MKENAKKPLADPLSRLVVFVFFSSEEASDKREPRLPDERLGVPRDDQFLVGGDDKRPYGRIRRGDFLLLAAAFVGLLVHLQPEITEGSENFPTQIDLVSPMPAVKTMASTPPRAAT